MQTELLIEENTDQTPEETPTATEAEEVPPTEAAPEPEPEASPESEPAPQANPLLPHHLKRIQDSAISEQVMLQRGYRSVLTQAELKRMGFAASQALAPTLLIPIWSVSDREEPRLLHHRPDQPRIKDGKPHKYEFPANCSMVVDVHPSLYESVRNPRIPLIITEGVRKADSAISIGLCCVGIVGVWNFRGKNELEGMTALPDWEYIAFKGKDAQGDKYARQIYICYDSDVMLKLPVYKALVRLARFCKDKGANVAYIYLPHGEDGSKIGLDDYLAAGHTKDDLLALATTELRKPPESEKEEESAETYVETEGGIVWNKPVGESIAPVHLTNFTARIVEEQLEDDGAETNLSFQIEAQKGTRQKRFTVSSATFASLNWVIEHLGIGAIISPGLSLKDHTRAAIQFLSGDPERHTVYKHIGWREVEPDVWVYLHSGGVIHAEDAPEVQVSLPDHMRHFSLPEPPTGKALQEAVYASLRLLELGPDGISFPVFAAIYRAALSTADFSVHLSGPSGAFKSELAALAQQHWGLKMNSRNLPGAWSSTDNALEGLAFSAKDALCVIDDFIPRGSTHDVQRLHAKADRVLRAQGNNSGRGRMKADGSLRPPKPPRGLILTTGEDTPTGQSLRGRMLILEVAHGDIPKDKLSQCQQEASEGKYAQALSAFLHWQSPRYAEDRAEWQKSARKLRDKAACSEQHRRTPDIIAQLAIGLRQFLLFAVEEGCLSQERANELDAQGWKALGQAANMQAKHQATSEPARRFIDLIRTALASKKAHLANSEGIQPMKAEVWGWRIREFTGDDGPVHAYDPQGDRIGWVNGGDVFLLPDAAYNVAKKMGAEGGEGLNIAGTTLLKRLKEGGWLASTDRARETLTIRRRLEGQEQKVLHLLGASLVSEKPDISDKPDEEENWE